METMFLVDRKRRAKGAHYLKYTYTMGPFPASLPAKNHGPWLKELARLGSDELPLFPAPRPKSAVRYPTF
jgi:hypothetical protein